MLCCVEQELGMVHHDSGEHFYIEYGRQNFDAACKMVLVVVGVDPKKS